MITDTLPVFKIFTSSCCGIEYEGVWFRAEEDAIAYGAEQNDPSNPYISYFYRKS